jgi:hypothetical protein
MATAISGAGLGRMPPLRTGLTYTFAESLVPFPQFLVAAAIRHANFLCHVRIAEKLGDTALLGLAEVLVGDLLDTPAQLRRCRGTVRGLTGPADRAGLGGPGSDHWCCANYQRKG